MFSSKDKYCEGFYNSKNNYNYILGVNFSVVKEKVKFSHEGSSILDQTNAFDLAEIASANLGQTNMIQVSSFCGPDGIIWGYDICKANIEILSLDFKNNRAKSRNIKIYDINPLINAFTRLTGTTDKPRFPFYPGSFVPSALKYITKKGPQIIYAAHGIGIPEDRKNSAAALMEDIGTIPISIDISDIETYKNRILDNLINSIITIGDNQKVKYKEIFVGIKHIIVNEHEIGCALISNPYFLLAQDANLPAKDLAMVNITEWEKNIKNKFIYTNNK
jgi:histidine decarboxylase